MNHLYKIKTKDQRLIQYKRNAAQSDFSKRRGQRAIILKARQLGFSTEGLIDLLDETVTHKNTNSAIIAHERDKVVKLFEIVRRAYDNMPDELKPRVNIDNRNELYFPDLDSKIFVTLNTRSETVHNLHVSELAFIRDAESKMAGILASVPKDCRITYESTADGMSGYFYDEWMSEDSGFEKFFYNWTWNEEYRLPTSYTVDQLQEEYLPLANRYSTMPDLAERLNLDAEQFCWYIETLKMQKDMMRQEFPSTALEAFIASGRNVFKIEDLNNHPVEEHKGTKWGDAKIWEYPLTGFKYVIGVDTAEGFGGDNSVIQVVNAHTGEQAAEYVSNRIEPSELAGYVIDIAKFYNRAYVVVEYNNTGISTIDSMKRRYTNLYRREQYDKASKQITQQIGWRTTGTTKPLLINNLEEALRDCTILIHSKELLKECTTFVRTDEQGKQGYGAEGSNKDDRVMALGLALQGIKNMPALKPPKTIAQQKLEQFIEFNKDPTSTPRPHIHPHFNNKKTKIRGLTH